MNTSTNVARGFQTSDDARQQTARRHKQIARLRRLTGAAILYLLLLAGSVLFLIPFVWMLTTSLKSQSEVMLLPIRWIPENWLWSNYSKALFGVVPFVTFFKNTITIVAFDLLGDVFVCALVGYASTIAWILFAIIMLFTLLVFRSSSLWVYYEGEVKKD